MSRFLVRLVSVLIALLLSGLATVVQAGEVVRFTEGRYMPIQSHEVEGDRIRLHLGDALVVVPSYRVAEIRKDRRLVYGTPLKRENLKLAKTPHRERASLARAESVPARR